MIEHARTLAERFSACGTVVHVLPHQAIQRLFTPGEDTAYDYRLVEAEQQLIRATQEWLATQLARAPNELRSAVRVGDPTETILAEARETGSHLLVIGREHTSRPRRFLLGSVASAVLCRQLSGAGDPERNSCGSRARTRLPSGRCRSGRSRLHWVAAMRAAQSSWKLVSEGDGKYRLEDHWGELVAWARRHAVGVNGFFSVAESIAAVPILVQAVDEVLEREHSRQRRPEVDYDKMRLVHDGAYAVVRRRRGPTCAAASAAGRRGA